MSPSKQNQSRPFGVFEWMVARRYLGATRSGRGVSLIAIIAFVGIMLAVAVLIIVMSVMQGFRAKLLDQALGLNGHVFIQTNDPPETVDDIIASVRALPGVKAAAPLLQADAYATSDGGETFGLVRGMRPDDLLAITELTGPGKIIAGSLDVFGAGKNGGNGIFIGIGLANALRVGVGDGVTIVREVVT